MAPRPAVFGLSSPSNDLGAILRPPEIGSNIAESRAEKRMFFLIAAKGYRRRAFNALSLRRLLNNCTVEFMVTVTDVEKVALDLSIPDRLVLISNLLQSLPPVLNDEDK